MADLKITIEEKLILSGVDRGTSTTHTISGINNIDNRILTIPSGSSMEILYFTTGQEAAGTFVTSSFKYGRVTNKSSVPAKLNIAYVDPPYYATFELTSGSSFLLSSARFTASFGDVGNYVFSDTITAITLEPSGSAATIEYFIATT